MVEVGEQFCHVEFWIVLWFIVPDKQIWNRWNEMLKQLLFIVQEKVIVYCINYSVTVESIMNGTFIFLFADPIKVYPSCQNARQMKL